MAEVPVPLCAAHLDWPPEDELVTPMAEFARALRARLELRYGVDVSMVTEKGDVWT